MQGLLSALQGYMKCLPEVFDLWNLYADYFLRGGFGSFRRAKFCWVWGLFHHTEPTGKLYMGLQNIYLGYLYSHVHYLWWLYLSNSVVALSFQLVFEPFIPVVRGCKLQL